VLPPAHRDIPGHGRPPAAALIVIDEGAAAGERVEAGQQIVVVRAGPAVQDDYRRTAPDLSLEEGDAPDLADSGALRPGALGSGALVQSSTASASATFRTSASSSAVNGSGTSLSISIWPSTVTPRRMRTTSSERVQRLHAM
jgi:hypothetical protein